MQTIAIAVLLIIAGLIGALLACATNLINRVRAATATLRRIEEALLSLNRVKTIEPAIESAEPVKQSQPAGAGRVGFLTLRDLRMMSSREEATRQTSAAVADRDPRFETSDVAPTQETLKGLENPNGLDSSFEISSPKLGQQIPNMDLRQGIDEAIVDVSQLVVTAVAETVPTAKEVLSSQKAREPVEEGPVAISPAIRDMFPEVSPSTGYTLREPEEAPTVESAVGREVPEVGQADQTAPTSAALDEAQKRKRQQQALMIMSSRRRRARAVH